MEKEDIVISKTLPPCIFRKAEIDPTYDGATSEPNQWKVIPTLPLAIYYETSIDLSGYSMRDLTFFPELGFFQEAPIFTITGNDGGTIYDTVVVSTVPLDPTSINTNVIVGSGPALPTFDPISIAPAPQTPTEWETIPYCKITVRTRNNLTPGDGGLTQILDTSQIGSLQPTAVDKLFIYRIVFPFSNTAPNNTFSQINVPAARVGFRGYTEEEPEIEYLMRLKRGYELANQVRQ